MKVVWSWLCELIEFDSDVSAEAAARALTAGGLELEDLEQVGNAFEGVVVAEVVGKRRHPDADKLTLVDVIDAVGAAPTEVVCGAPNVPDVGGRVLWAKPGARLLGGAEISLRTIKGVESAGMLCSETEIGVGDDGDGIVVLDGAEAEVPLGSDPRTSVGLADVVFDIGVPANRPDCQGHLGIARELVALLAGGDPPVISRLSIPQASLEDLTSNDLVCADLVSVSIGAPQCARFTGRVIDGLTVGPSPRWLRRRLEMVGVRPVSNLVDVTNYVMFERGQPLHAFDYRHIRDQRIEVRLAATDESITTLDGAVRQLTPNDLLICDGQGPVALAGVMGGADSEVADDTTRVLLEAAQFDPITIRRTGRRLGLRSEAAHRFERYVDPNGCAAASERAAELLARVGGGQIARGLVDAYPEPAQASVVEIRPSRATALTGMTFDSASSMALFARLGLESEARGEDRLAVTIPTSRFDLNREVDLIEELIRLRGFDKVPATLPPLSKPPSARLVRREDIARDALIGAGLSEAITFGFTSPANIEALDFEQSDPRSRPISLRNPMTNRQSVMRTSLLATLLPAVAQNLRHQVIDIALFEIGSVFIGSVAPDADGSELPAEPQKVAGVLTGQRMAHLGDGRPVGLFDIKGVLDLLVDVLPTHSEPLEAVATATIPYLHPGLSGELRTTDGQVLGVFGEVHPAVRDAFEIEVPVFAFEVGLDQFPDASAKQMRSIPKFPASSRDLSFWIDRELPANDVMRAVFGAGQTLLEKAALLEDFRDEKYVPDGKKGMLWSLTYRSHEGTLTDAEVDAAHEALCATILDQLSATRR